jgi:hypothetical protein
VGASFELAPRLLLLFHFTEMPRGETAPGEPDIKGSTNRCLIELHKPCAVKGAEKYIE